MLGLYQMIAWLRARVFVSVFYGTRQLKTHTSTNTHLRTHTVRERVWQADRNRDKDSAEWALTRRYCVAA